MEYGAYEKRASAWLCIILDLILGLLLNLITASLKSNFLN